MKIKIYAEDPNPDYLKGLYYLEKEGKIELELINSRIFSLIYGFFRGKVDFKDVIKSITALFKLIFCDNIILSTGPYGNKVYYFLLLKLLKKNIIYYNSWPYWNNKDRYINRPILFNRFFWKLFLKNTKVATVTNFGVEQVNKLGAKGYYKPQCIDINLFKDIREKRKKNAVLFVGRLIKEKGVEEILDVAKELKDIEFWFVGDGPLKEKIKGNNIKYLGFKTKEELVNIYNKATIFVLNSYSIKNWEEFFGIVLLEAMSCGLPVISTDCIGPKELIVNGENGFLIPQKNKEILLKRIKELIKNKKLREKFRENGKENLKKFGIQEISRTWENIIKD